MKNVSFSFLKLKLVYPSDILLDSQRKWR